MEIVPVLPVLPVAGSKQTYKKRLEGIFEKKEVCFEPATGDTGNIV